jgi:hypothetical protein
MENIYALIINQETDTEKQSMVYSIREKLTDLKDVLMAVSFGNKILIK